MASVLQPSNRVVKTITYDALDRMLLESYGVGARENTAYSWDQHGSRNDTGQLLAVTRGTGLVAKYTYDPNGRRLERTVENASLSYSLGMSDTFDVGGAIIRQRIPGGAGFGFGYDAFRRLRSITFGQGADSVPVLSDARYRSNDLVDGYRLGARLRANYGYETQRSFMTTNKVVRHPAGNPTAVQDTLLLQKLEWDASGNVAGMQRPIGDTLGYRHDRLGQLRATVRAGGMDSLQYDANGNRVRHRFTLDGGVPDSLAYNANRVAWMRTARNGHTLFRHDVLGNLTLEAHFASAADTTDLSKAWKIVERKFNRRNELERMVVKDRQTMDSTLWAYDYDEAGNRIMKRYAANLDTTQWKTERRYAYDGVNVVADSGRADSSWTWHVFQGYNRLALADKPGSALRVKYLLNDHLGTATVMVDDTSRVLAKYARDPWGNLESPWESTPLRWQFTGKEQDPEVGGNVFYFNARFYDAERGAFIGRDPKLQLYTPYGFTANSPLGAIDSDGARTIWLGGAGNMTNTAMYSVPIVKKMADAGISDPMWVPTPRAEGMLAQGVRAAKTFFESYGENVPLIKSWYSRAEDEQFNLVGYSQGSVEAIQTALSIAKDGKIVDNLILIGSPLAKDNWLVEQALNNPNIRSFAMIEIQGDALTGQGLDINKHFYYTTNEAGQQDRLIEFMTHFGVK